MKQKKPILLYCADRDLLSTVAFALRLHPYEVTATSDSSEASYAIGDRHTGFACVVLIHSQTGDLAGRLIYRVLEHAAHLPILLVDRAGDLAPIRYVDVVLYGRNTTMEHILAALKMLSSRTPGPKARMGI